MTPSPEPALRLDAAASAAVERAFDLSRALEENLSRQINSIRASDAKIQLLVPTTTAMIGVLAALLRGPGPNLYKAGYALVGVLPLVCALGFMALTVIPRLRSSSGSLLYFGGIVSRPLDAYCATMLDLDADAYLSDLAAQCHVTAGIAAAKYRHVRSAYLCFFVALPCWALAIFLLNGSG